VRIELNGQAREISDGTTVAALIASVADSSRGSAAVVDGAVVPRGSWATAVLREGQTVELITAVQGG
jgi:sulfur carrier protein